MMGTNFDKQEIDDKSEESKMDFLLLDDLWQTRVTPEGLQDDGQPQPYRFVVTPVFLLMNFDP